MVEGVRRLGSLRRPLHPTHRPGACPGLAFYGGLWDPSPWRPRGDCMLAAVLSVTEKMPWIVQVCGGGSFGRVVLVCGNRCETRREGLMRCWGTVRADTAGEDETCGWKSDQELRSYRASGNPGSSCTWPWSLLGATLHPEGSVILAKAPDPADALSLFWETRWLQCKSSSGPWPGLSASQALTAPLSLQAIRPRATLPDPLHRGGRH